MEALKNRAILGIGRAYSTDTCTSTTQPELACEADTEAAERAGEEAWLDFEVLHPDSIWIRRLHGFVWMTYPPPDLGQPHLEVLVHHWLDPLSVEAEAARVVASAVEVEGRAEEAEGQAEEVEGQAGEVEVGL
jgi:hypothetical protein